MNEFAGRLQPHLVDTNILIDYLRGRPVARDYVDGAPVTLFLSAITIAELYAGVREGAEREHLDAFVSAFEIIPLDTDIAVLGGLYRRQYGRSYGTGLTDALIAATAALRGFPLVTLNHKHFPMLTNVVVPY